jgi:hypothetical protein
MMKVLKLDDLRDDKKKSGVSDIKKSGFREETRKSILAFVQKNMPYDVLNISKKQISQNEDIVKSKSSLE